MRKRIFSLIFAALLVLGCGVNALAATGQVFTDVGEDYSWAKDAIESFAGQGIIDGVGDGKFEPDGAVTREQFAKMLALSFNAELVTGGTPTFSDVSSDSWSYQYIEAVRDFLTGYSSPTSEKLLFKPTVFASREDIAVALVRILGYTVDTNDSSYAQEKFSDFSSISINLRPYVSLASEKGLINGYTDGTFGPQAGITRAETVVMLSRAMKQVATPEKPEEEAALSLLLDTVEDTVSENSITVSGKVSAGTSVVSVTVNNKAVSVSSSGRFSTEVSLSEGENTIKVIAKAENGKSAEKTVSVKYKKSELPVKLQQGYGYVTQDTYKTTRNGEIVYAVSFWNGAENYICMMSDPSYQPKSGALIYYESNGKGDLTACRALDGRIVAVSAFEMRTNGIMAFDGDKDKVYEFDANTVYIAVNTSSGKGVGGANTATYM